MLNKNITYIIAIVLSCLIFLTGCNKIWDDHYKAIDNTTEKDKIISEMENIPEISKFTEAVKGIDTLAQLLDQNRLYTVFAPVNGTFEQIDAEIVNNDTLLTRLILYHFIHGKFKHRDFESGIVTTFNEKELSISVANSKVTLDGNSSIVQSDILSKNGMIHVLDKPVVPIHNLHEYFIFNPYTREFSDVIPQYTIRTFNRSASTPIGENNNNEVIYDSVFYYSNPFLYWESNDPPVNFYGKEFITFMDISDETELYTFVFPENYETALNTVKNGSFLNKEIADHHWSGPVLANLIMLGSSFSKDKIISEIESYHSDDDNDSIKVLLHFADLLKNNFTGSDELSNGLMHRVNGFEYDPGWLITDKGNKGFDEKNRDYASRLSSTISTSENIDTVYVEVYNTKTVFHYNEEDDTGYESKYGEWVNYDLDGDFYPVDYRILVRGQNFASGTFMIEADGQEIGEYNFANAPSGNNDDIFDEIGIISFTEIKSASNVKFTFINTHPETNKGEQYLWIREIKLSPILN